MRFQGQNRMLPPAKRAVITALVPLWSVLAVTAWADRGFLCAGQVAPATPWLLGPAKSTQVEIASNGTGIVLFAHFKDELPANTETPDWADAIFDPDRPGSFSHFYDTMSFGQHRFRGEEAPR